MNWTGKIIGFIIGILSGNPLILILGLVIGHLFDKGLIQQWLGLSRLHAKQQSKVQDIFFNNTFMIMGYVAKVDGRVSENEIHAARKIMNQMGLDNSMKHEAIRLFNKGKDANFDLNNAIHQLKQACWYRPSLLRIFLEIQTQMAYADGKVISDRKRETLEYICRQFGLIGFNFSHFEQRFRAEQNYQRYEQKTYQDPQQHLSEAYKVLGISSSASNAEVKKAYRRLMSQHHPDKLMSKGLPPEMIKMATQKTQQIKKAYEQIKKSRNL